jgi:hypothetical protein
MRVREWLSPAVAVTAVAACFLAGGCQRSSAEAGTVPAFEIRQVRCDRQASESAWSYECRATLVTRDEKYQHGQLVIYFVDTSKDSNGRLRYLSPVANYVVMTDGIATLSSGAYYPRKRQIGNMAIDEFPQDPGAPQPDWKIVGFARIEGAETKKE